MNKNYCLIVKEGVKKGKRYRLTPEGMTIGRNPESKIFVDDKTASRLHAQVVKKGDDYYIADCGSKLGTFLNQGPVREERLAINDEIKIGQTVFVFLADDTEDITPAHSGGLLKPDKAGDSEVTAVISNAAAAGETFKVFPDNIEMLETPYLVILGKAGYLLHGFDNLSELFRKVISLIFEAVCADSVCVVLADKGAGNYGLRLAGDKSGQELEMKPPAGIGDAIFSAGVSTLNAGIISSGENAAADGSAVRQFKYAVCAPLKYKETILGFIYVESSIATGALTYQDLQFITTLGLIAGTAAYHLERDK